MKLLSEHTCHGGKAQYFEHDAKSTSCKMRFSIFLPPQSQSKKCPALFYLAGLTCTEENFTTKANAYKLAAKLGLILIAPDTSPRGEEVPDEEGYDLGKGAGFYLNATATPWDKHYQMESYIVEELRELLVKNHPVDSARLGIFGHSMGGHGALTLFLKYPHIYSSVSAFAPICAPKKCSWGQKALTTYLGEESAAWDKYDATCLMEASAKTWPSIARAPILIDQGLSDDFLKDQLHPELFESACGKVSHPIEIRRQEGYDHGYFFIQTFINDHLRHHWNCLE